MNGDTFTDFDLQAEERLGAGGDVHARCSALGASQKGPSAPSLQSQSVDGTAQSQSAKLTGPSPFRAV